MVKRLFRAVSRDGKNGIMKPFAFSAFFAWHIHPQPENLVLFLHTFKFKALQQCLYRDKVYSTKCKGVSFFRYKSRLNTIITEFFCVFPHFYAVKVRFLRDTPPPLPTPHTAQSVRASAGTMPCKKLSTTFTRGKSSFTLK